MKKLAQLIIFFSLSFAVILAVSAGFRFLILRVQWLRSLPIEEETPLTALIAAARWALSAALFGSLALSLSYTARRRVFVPAAIVCLIVLSLSFSFGISFGLKQLEMIPPRQFSAVTLGGEGIILRQANTSVVLLKGPAESRGARVTLIAGRPLLYQAKPVGPNNTALALPPLPLGNESPWFLKSIAIDLRLNAEQLRGRFDAGIIPFSIYTGALIFLLVSLGFIFKLSVWPLANLFCGCLVFRLILNLETFLNSPEMQATFTSFLGNRLPASLTVPLIFCVFGLLVFIYSILVYLAKRRGNEEIYQ